MTQTATHQSHTITKQQRAILLLIFAYRFITISHLMTHLGHRQKYRIQTWLNDLKIKGCIYQIYDQKSLKASGTPAIYYLASAGVRYIRSLGTYQESELRKRYADTTRTKVYIDHCLLMADCCSMLLQSCDETKRYVWSTPTDYAYIEGATEVSEFLMEQRPHLYFTKKSGEDVADYVIEHIPERLAKTYVRRRVRMLINHDYFHYENQSAVLLLICETLPTLIDVKRYVRLLIRNEDKEYPSVRITTVEQIRTHGIVGSIWEEIE